jgi:hypothetical protein
MTRYKLRKVEWSKADGRRIVGRIGSHTVLITRRDDVDPGTMKPRTGWRGTGSSGFRVYSKCECLDEIMELAGKALRYSVLSDIEQYMEPADD